MSEVFISYARPRERQAAAVAALLRARGFTVWRDDDIPPHRPFGDVIAERLEIARAVVVLWSEEAARSHWVRAEAEHARMNGKLVQLSLDGAPLPLPFAQIQCEDLSGWTGEGEPRALRKVMASVGDLVGRPGVGRPGVGRSGDGLANGPGRADGRAHLHVALLGDEPIGHDIRADVAAALGNQPALKVMADLREAPDYRLEVQARAAGGRLRATVRLLALPGGDQLWSSRFDGVDAELFDWQDRVAQEVAASVEAVVRRARLARAAISPDSESARRMAAAAAINRMTPQGFAEALALLAGELAGPAPAPEAGALAALAHASLWIGGYPGTGLHNREDGMAHARAALARTDSDPFPTGLSAVALAHFGAPVETSLSLVDRVQALTPGFAPALMWAGQVRLIAGDADGAIDRLERAHALDPRMSVRPLLLGYLGAARLFAGALGPARTVLLEAAETAGELPLILLFLAAAHALAGDLAARDSALARAAAVAPPADFRLPLVASHRAKLAGLIGA